MKNNRLFTKVIAAVAIAAVTLTSAAVFSPKNVQAAETTSSERIISDTNATAHINADGSGYIELKNTFTSADPLTQIGGVALKEIITFNDGGYIDAFYTYYDSTPLDENGCVSDPCPNVVRVHGRGPEGFFNGSGYLHFTDKTNDTYNLSIWRHAEAWHQVRYNSTQPTITKISWNS